MDNGYSLSDLRAATGDGNSFGGNGAWWMVILFLICFMGGGFWGNRQGEFGQYATAASQQEILFGQHFGQLNDRLTNLGNGVCNLGFEMQGGSFGAHWDLEQTRPYMEPRGVTCELWKWAAVMNMMYSDYCKAARKNSVDRPEFYADLAAAFLEDKDAPEDKAGRYYHNIAAVQE